MEKQLLRFLVLMSVTSLAYAQSPTDSMTMDIINEAMSAMAPVIVSKGMTLLGSLLILQWVLTHWHQLVTNSDLGTVTFKTVFMLIWAGGCIYVIENGPEFIRAVGTWFFSEFASYFPSVSDILLATTSVSGGLVVVGVAVGQINTTAGLAVLGIVALILIAGIALAGKILLLQIELALNVFTAPFSFAFLGLNALRDQGLAPFRALISLMYRILIYAVLCAAFVKLSEASAKIAQQYSSGNILSQLANGYEWFKVLLGSAIAHGVLLMLLFRSDQIAANLSSGSTSLNTADLAAAAMTTTAATAMAGNVASNVTGKAEGVGALMDKLLGPKGVGVSNASSDGMGEFPGAMSKPYSPGNMSVNEGGSGASRSSDQTGGAASSESGGGDALPPDPNEFRGVPNSLPTPQRDAQRDAARAERRAAAQRAKSDAGGSDGGRQSAMPADGGKATAVQESGSQRGLESGTAQPSQFSTGADNRDRLAGSAASADGGGYDGSAVGSTSPSMPAGAQERLESPAKPVGAQDDAMREERRKSRFASQADSDEGAGIGGKAATVPAAESRAFERLAHELERGKAETRVTMTARGD